MRFKIRTLMLLMVVVAILIAFFAKPYIDVVAERNAIDSLDKDWGMLIDSEAKLGDDSKVATSTKLTNWRTYPIRAIFGEEYLARHNKLRLFQPESKTSSLAPLKALTNVTHLKINPISNNAFVMDETDCRYVGAMKNLTELEIGCAVNGGLKHLRQLKLERLVCHGPSWSQEEFDAIGSIHTLKFIQLRTKQFDTDSIAALSNLQNLETMYLGSETKAALISGLEAIQKMPQLKHLHLYGTISEQELRHLANNDHLVSIGITGLAMDQAAIRQWPNNTSLKYASFGHMQISVETYDSLVAAGIEVEHYGLTGDELTENYFQYNDIYYPVDFEKSSISAWINPKTESVNYTIEVDASKKPRHHWSAVMPPSLELYSLGYNNDWRDMAGFKTKQSTDWAADEDTGNFYDGIHSRVNDHEIEIVSRTNNRFHIRWELKVGDAKDDNVEAFIDADIAFKRIFVQNYQTSYTIEQATTAVAMHFDLTDLLPAKLTGRSDALIQFDFKPTE